MKINVNSLSSRRLHLDYRLPRGFVTFLESKTQDEETQVRLNGLQPLDKGAMLGVKTKEYFLEEFT